MPLKIRPLPGGFAIEFADKSKPIMVYGREPHVARAANSPTLDEAKLLAQDVARALTIAWSGHGPQYSLPNRSRRRWLASQMRCAGSSARCSLLKLLGRVDRRKWLIGFGDTEKSAEGRPALFHFENQQPVGRRRSTDFRIVLAVHSNGVRTIYDAPPNVASLTMASAMRAHGSSRAFSFAVVCSRKIVASQEANQLSGSRSVRMTLASG